MEEARTAFQPEKYDKVLIDGTIFIHPLPAELCSGLQPEKCYISKSFAAECELLRPCMTQQQQAVLEQNLKTLSNAISKDRILSYADSTWENLCALSQRRGKFLFVTANRLLVQKIVLRQLQVDVYDLHDLKFLPEDSFGTLQDAYRCQIDKKGSGTQKLADQLMVYREDGTIAMLKCHKDTGTEAVIYEDRERPGTLVKILRSTYRTELKIENIRQLRQLQQQLECPWAAFPLELVYRDAAQKEALGFVMLSFPGMASLENWSNHSARDRYQLKVSRVLLWCRMIASQVAYLGVFGICISDFNKQNFLVANDRDELPMLDTDSFNMGSYYGSRQGPDAGPALRELSREGGWNKADIIDLCQERLYELLFTLLNETADPDDGGQSYAPLVQLEGQKYFVAQERPWAPLFAADGERRYIFPGLLWKLMEQVFTRNVPPVNLPSMDALLYAILETEKQIAADPGQYDRSYVQLREQYRAGGDWPINGLREKPEEPAQPEQPSGTAGVKTGPSPSAPRPAAPRRKQVDRENPFTAARLMGLVVRQPETPLPENRKHPLPKNIGNGRIDRQRQREWMEAVERDEARARKLRRRLTWLLMALMVLGVLWLMLFSDSQLALGLRDLAADLAAWWEDNVLPLQERSRTGGLPVLPSGSTYLAA